MSDIEQGKDNPYFYPHSIQLQAQVPKVPLPGLSTSNDKDAFGIDHNANDELDEMLDARHAELQTIDDLLEQRGTNIPALYNQVYKFIQNPSSVSVETFKRMVDTDETIGSGIDFLTTCLAARMGQYTHPVPEISKWVNDRLNEIEGGWMNACKEMLTSSWAGFSVAEKVWANTINGFTIKKLVQLPPGTLLFETERTGELTPDGILQYQRNYNPALFGAGTAYLFGFTGVGFSSEVGGASFRPDLYAKFGDLPFPIRSANIYSYLSIRIPVRKCLHHKFNVSGMFGNPYGRSLLRRAYKHWVLKDAVLQMLAIALDRKGTPLTMVYVDPNNTFIDVDQHTNGANHTKKNVGIRAQEAVKRAFEKIHNDSVIILPGKKGQFIETDVINHASNASDFIAALDFLNRSMMRAMLIPSLVFSNGDGSGSFALGQEHSKTFDKILDGFLSGFTQTIIDQMISEMIAYNFPKETWEKHGQGSFAKRELSIEEREKEMACIATAIDKGAIDMTDLDDLNKVREISGFKPRTTPMPVEEITDEDDPETTEGKDPKEDDDE